jgi:CDP-2,3-bis-(O-geranylgeranyl)-sn-glycerol synthase
MHTWLVSHLVLLLVIANGTPVLLRLLLGSRWNRPLDNHRQFTDKRPLLGASKTLRGLIGSVLVTALLAPLFELSVLEGAGFALLAMLGDLCSSFLKRRLDIASSRSAPLLDQLPESLLPLWGMQSVLGASAGEIALAVMIFTVIDLLLSRPRRSARN